MAACKKIFIDFMVFLRFLIFVSMPVVPGVPSPPATRQFHSQVVHAVPESPLQGICRHGTRNSSRADFRRAVLCAPRDSRAAFSAAGLQMHFRARRCREKA